MLFLVLSADILNASGESQDIFSQAFHSCRVLREINGYIILAKAHESEERVSQLESD